MEISTGFDLPLPPAQAYALLLDLEQVAPCLPGAALGAEREDGTREVTVTVRLGPMKFVYGGTVQIGERDDAALRAVLLGTAEENRGMGSARATISMSVAPDGERSSHVESQAVFELTGRAAQTGRGIVEDVARRMVEQMAACLAERAQAAGPAAPAGAAPPPAEAPPIRAGSLLFSILRQRLSRLRRR